MIVNNEIENEIQNYLDNLNVTRNGFEQEFEEIKNKYIKRITNNIIDKIYEEKTFVIPSDSDIKEKLEYSLNPLIYDYCDEISAYINFNNRIINDSVEAVDSSHLEIDFPNMNEVLSNHKLNYSEEDKSKLKQMISKASDSVLTHIGFRNLNNPDYHKNLRNLEEYVREEVKKGVNSMYIDTNDLYNHVVEQLNNSRNNFVEGCNTYYNNEVQKNKQEIGDNFLSTTEVLEGIDLPDLPKMNEKRDNFLSTTEVLEGIDLPDLPKMNEKRDNFLSTTEVLEGIDLPDLPKKNEKGDNFLSTNEALDEEYHTQELDREVIKKRMQELRDSLVPEEESENAKLFK